MAIEFSVIVLNYLRAAMPPHNPIQLLPLDMTILKTGKKLVKVGAERHWQAAAPCLGNRITTTHQWLPETHSGLSPACHHCPAMP